LGIRVLVVEDVKASHELILESIHLVGGFDVVGNCTTEVLAQQWLHDHPTGCDLVVLDLMLREGSGFSVLNQLQRRQRAPQIVVFSDFSTPAVAQKCRALGAMDAISKQDYRQLRVFLERFRGETLLDRPAVDTSQRAH
jgi:DNA-binding NarL/FixJ family response regulator